MLLERSDNASLASVAMAQRRLRGAPRVDQGAVDRVTAGQIVPPLLDLVAAGGPPLGGFARDRGDRRERPSADNDEADPRSRVADVELVAREPRDCGIAAEDALLRDGQLSASRKEETARGPVLRARRRGPTPPRRATAW